MGEVRSLASGRRIIASVKYDGQVYLFCGPGEMMQWPTPQAAGKFFKRLYSLIYRAGGDGLKQFHLLADFRLHSVSLKSFLDDSFEKSVVKAEVDRDRVLKPEEYSIIPIELYGVSIQALPCYGNSAYAWHKSGTRPSFPNFSKVSV